VVARWLARQAWRELPRGHPADLPGLLAVTFFIGRVMPIDPVLAIVGDRAPEHVVQRVREELGLNKPLYHSSSAST
jgi:ABC-type dipeptide/oligopeptide/nickel transport system permease component